MKISEILTQYNTQLLNNSVNTQKRDFLSESNYSQLYAQKINDIYSGNKFNESLNYVLSELDEKTSEFSSLINSFHFPDNDNSRYFRSTQVSDPEKIEAVAQSDASPGAYYIKIENTAQSQINKSKPLSSQSGIELNEGTYEFSLQTEDSSHLFRINLDKNQISTNRELLQGLETELNSVKTDLDISLQEKQKKTYTDFQETVYTDMSYLKLQHNKSGYENRFQLQDEAGSLIDFLELNKISNSAQDASYILNGIRDFSSDNSISLDNDELNIALKKESGDFVLVEVKKGEEQVLDNIQEIVDSYNNYLNLLEENHSFIQPGLKYNIAQMALSRSSDLQSIGINVQKDTAKLELTEYFQSALRNRTEEVKDILTSPEEGFFTNLGYKLQEVEDTPIQAYGNNRDQFLTYTRWGMQQDSSSRNASSSALNIYT